MSKKPKGGDKWQPKGEDAFKLAALRWWALVIEQVAIEAYATDRKRFKDLSRILSTCRDQLKGLPGATQDPAFVMCRTDLDCPDGFYCNEGTCEPIDGGVISTTTTKTKRS
jgi:Cys-rich repeat protein